MKPRLTTLPSGLRIVTDEMDSVETVSLGIWVDIGTRHEPAEINGVAHLLEHMAFKGTERRSARAIAEEIEAVGGHLNAYTARETTAYYAKVLRADVPLAVDLLGDILQNSVFDEAELDRERTVILQEIGQANDTPDDIVYDLFQERAYPDQAMGRPVLGRPEIIESIDRATVARYLKDSYSAPNMVLAAAGHLRHDELVDLAARAFDRLPAQSQAKTEPARYTGGDLREERDLEQTHLLLGFPGLSFSDPDHYAGIVLSTILGGGMSSRLFQEVREKRGLVYSIYAFMHGYRDGGIFGVYAGTGPESVSELMPVLCHEMRHAGENVTPAELARARAQIKAGILMSLESTSSRCETLAQHLQIYDQLFDPADVVARIEAVDEAAIARVAQRFIAGTPTLTALGPVGGIESFDALQARFA